MPYNQLIFLIASPILPGILCLALPDRLKGIIKSTAFLATLAALAVSISVFIKKPVIMQTGNSAIFIADNLSAFIGIGISLFAFLTAVYSFSFIEKSFGRYFGCLLMTLGSSFGVAFANDLIILMVFWGFLAVTLYLLINIKGTNDASRAAKKAMILVGGTDALMIFGVGLIWILTGTFAMDRIHLDMKAPLALLAYLSIAIASFAKAGVMPFHSWLPDAAEFGPAPVTAYLPASLDKLLGIYLLTRISLNMFVMNDLVNTMLALAGAATIIFAVIFALIQHDLKRLLGYHAVSQVGYMVLGIGTGTPIGIAGGIFHMINNAIYKSCLFLAGGNVEKKAGTADLDKLGGLAKYMPVTFAAFLVASLSISGIPPFNGFVSKWMIYQGIIESARPGNPLWILWLVSAMFGSALTIASFMKLLHAVFLGRSARDFRNIKEAGFLMLFPVVILAIICIAFGVFAFLLPLPMLIMPAVGLSLTFLGTWAPIAATILIVIGIIAGLLVYTVLKPKKCFRAVPTFIGGEEADSIGRISGADFYNTIRDMRIIGAICKKEEEGSLDIYEEGAKGTFLLSGFLQWLHNGVLPTYMVWCLMGMLALFIVFMR
ncbi:MAG: proton-conducting transporter membrane subunit [Candidatus Omnitrophota bacterium]